MGPRSAVGSPRFGSQAGATYLGLLFFIAASSFAIVATFEVWHTVVQREKEAELLAIGNEFRNALKGYYEARPANVIGQPVRMGQRPKQLEDLLTDNRFTTPQRWLRKIYVDPMSGKAEWGVVTLPDGQITGVHSLSDGEPLKQGGFKGNDADFNEKTRYADWVFSPKIKQGAAVGGVYVQYPTGNEPGSGGTMGPPGGSGSPGGTETKPGGPGGAGGLAGAPYVRQWKEQTGVVWGNVTPRPPPNARLRQQ